MFRSTPVRHDGLEGLKRRFGCKPIRPSGLARLAMAPRSLSREIERAPFAYLAPLVKGDKTQPRIAHPNRPGGLGPGVVRTKPHPGSGRPTRHARPGVAGNRAWPRIGTGEGFGMTQTRPGGAGGGGIDKYFYALLARTLVHVIWYSIA